MEKIFKTTDNKFINLSDIVSIEEINGNAHVYLESSSDYLILKNIDYQILKMELGFPAYCSPTIGRQDNENTIIWPDTSKGYEINSETNWVLHEILQENTPSNIFSSINIQKINYNKNTKKILFLINNTTKTFNISNGYFRLKTTDNDFYDFKNGQRYEIGAKDYYENVSGVIEYFNHESNNIQYFMNKTTQWTLSYIDIENNNVNVECEGFINLQNIFQITIYLSGRGNTIYFWTYDENYSEIYYEFELKEEIDYILTSKNPNSLITFTINGIKQQLTNQSSVNSITTEN